MSNPTKQTDRQPGSATPSDYAHSPRRAGRAATTGAETMSKTYENISDEWGSRVPCTFEDYVAQCLIFGERIDSLTCDSDGVYFDGIMIGMRIE
jgi:hypothetical protein